MKNFIINPSDNVTIALTNLKKGDVLEIAGDKITLLNDVPFAHKIALKDLAENTEVIKYGEVIGVTSCAVKKGEWVHTHNVVRAQASGEYKYEFNEQSVRPGKSDITFMGYDRESGEAGIRNYIGIMPTVFCANGPVQKICDMMNIKYPKTDNFDGFYPLLHSSGCSQSGEDLELTSKVLANVAKNANFGGMLYVELGCEVNDLKQMAPYIGDYNPERTKFMRLQEVADEFEEGMKLCEELYKVVSQDYRKPLNIEKLSISYNCGGSDGFSGFTANLLVGMITDKLTALGGTTNLTEVPEMFGAEHILMNRAKDKEIFDKTVTMIKDFKAYFKKYDQDPEDNKTQGNTEGGLTTLADKSLGCIQKGGKSLVSDIVQHGDRIKEKGFNIVVGPGNDLAGITAQVAAGSVLTLFTTGRGTPCGFIGPTFRLASNSTLYNRKPDWNDFNAGRIVDGEDPNALSEELYEAIIATCEGRYRTKNEVNGYYSIGIFKDGVVD